MVENDVKRRNVFLYILLGMCVVAVASSFYFFYFKKDFDFIIEAPCDRTKEQCFIRDCTDPDACPPNGLSDFKRYDLKASDFQYCKDEDCSSVCESGQIECTPIACSEDVDMGESCSVFAPRQEGVQ